MIKTIQSTKNVHLWYYYSVFSIEPFKSFSKTVLKTFESIITCFIYLFFNLQKKTLLFSRTEELKLIFY